MSPEPRPGLLAFSADRTVDTTTEHINIEYQYEATNDAEERLAQAMDLVLRLILSDSPPSPPTKTDDPPSEALR